MRAVLSALACAGAASARCPSRLAPGEHLRSVTVGGRERRFYTLVPHDMPQEARPGVVAIHGCGSSPSTYEMETTLNVHAERAKVYNVYPEGTTTGTRLGWNAGASGTCQTGGLVNDVDFMRAVVLDMVENLCVDTDRIYAAGFSNGGSMTFNLTCEMPDVFAAFSVTGMSEHTSTHPANCGLSADQVRPMVAFCGAADSLCRSFASSWTPEYAQRSGCRDSPASDRVTGTTTKTSYAECGASGRQPFDAYLIDGLGHCWSGNDCCASDCRNQNPANVDSTAALLSFFDAVPVVKGAGADALQRRLRRQLGAVTAGTLNATN